MDEPEPELRVLGRVQLRGRPLRSAAAQHVLSWAVVHAGRGVDLGRSARVLWPELPAAAGARKARDAARALAREFPDSVRAAGDQLELTIAPQQIDEQAFRALVLAGEDADATAEPRRLSAALRLWHGRPYPGLGHVPLVQHRIAELENLRLGAVERRFTLALDRADGPPDVALVAELRAAVCSHPQRERLWRLLAAALFASSRQLEALREIESCSRGRRARGESRSARLDALRTAVLRGDEAAVRSAV